MTLQQGAEAFAGACDACRASKGPFLKVSLGKDFFGRAYDRLSPSSDQSPKWYCESCSLHKNLQRDFRDIKMEFDKLHAGETSQLADHHELQRACLRLREITAMLGGSAAGGPLGTRLIDPADVTGLLRRMETRTGAPSPVE